MTIVKLTVIPQLNSVVIKQYNGHFFIAAPNSIIIDKDGLLALIKELENINFIDRYDLEAILDDISLKEEEEMNED